MPGVRTTLSEKDHSQLKKHTELLRMSQSDYLEALVNWAIKHDPKELIDHGVPLPIWPYMRDE